MGEIWARVALISILYSSICVWIGLDFWHVLGWDAWIWVLMIETFDFFRAEF